MKHLSNKKEEIRKDLENSGERNLEKEESIVV
jgi:hypothetical protein